MRRILFFRHEDGAVPSGEDEAGQKAFPPACRDLQYLAELYGVQFAVEAHVRVGLLHQRGAVDQEPQAEHALA